MQSKAALTNTTDSKPGVVMYSRRSESEVHPAAPDGDKASVAGRKYSVIT